MLQTEPDDKPTEYGAIEVNLNALPEKHEPWFCRPNSLWGGFSTITVYPIRAPRAFLKVAPDGPIVEAFGTVEADYLFGRNG